MQLNPHRLLCTLALCAGLSTTLALAAAPSFDFTGHWVGMGTDHHGSFDISADLTSTSATAFSGTFITPRTGTCTLSGRRRRTHLTLHLACAGKSLGGSGHLNVATQTGTGGFNYVGSHGHHQRHATFTLIKTS